MWMFIAGMAVGVVIAVAALALIGAWADYMDDGGGA